MAEDSARWGDDRTPFDYRWEHVRAVVRLATRLAECTGADRDVCEAAAWLHDVGRPRSQERRTSHGIEGAAMARDILAQSDFPPDKIEAVVDAIAKHSGLETSDVIEPLEAAVLWDADKLTKLGATIVLHATGYFVSEGRKTTEALIKALCNDHWGDGIVRCLNTAPARAVGRERLATYRNLCTAAKREFRGDDLLRAPRPEP
jgi:uncharacterized protein